ncbi:hydrolase [Sulfolobus sp. A20]|uniref:MBL fold metallo-hydrolase n=1 Tax=Sulfolobaceae TaxID=118883 RepID=UPI000845D7E7|nr:MULTISPECIES: MBL fold metallo-hydrolase [unclassified Sulfolobus]TRM77664.1 hydrolase [Sulfolobus sp. B5]TRM78457.1 hydrolase [Sulfolobus sp. A20-N-F8]TRM82132.1 hydrolase [Sulfolobus sp. D5]TRM84472.1 hydrolase [Sulfolobus sp. F3]TRM87615.1 hydrolase [Sulfolobus sp. E3]TRM89214.1 hydrolase [Sulfolobus sp. C3]TRM99974.1 hydrolase [Sulfolobus sp. E1]TRN03606.1 hydrolase [Sulfolobus sp. F1]
MRIKFFGHSCVLIDDKILVDPHDGGSIGLPKPDVKDANLILITHDHYDHNAYQLFQYKDLKINYYGEFKYEDYVVKGLKTFHDKYNGKLRGENTVYVIKRGDKKVVHLGDIGHLPDEKIYDEISAPDVLLIPIGGVITIDYKEALEIIHKTTPKIIIPIHFWVKGHYMPLDPPDNFLLNIQGYQIKQIDFKNNEIDIADEQKIVYVFKT